MMHIDRHSRLLSLGIGSTERGSKDAEVYRQLRHSYWMEGEAEKGWRLLLDGTDVDLDVAESYYSHCQ